MKTSIAIRICRKIKSLKQKSRNVDTLAMRFVHEQALKTICAVWPALAWIWRLKANFLQS